MNSPFPIVGPSGGIYTVDDSLQIEGLSRRFLYSLYSLLQSSRVIHVYTCLYTVYIQSSTDRRVIQSIHVYTVSSLGMF